MAYANGKCSVPRVDDEKQCAAGSNVMFDTLADSQTDTFAQLFPNYHKGLVYATSGSPYVTLPEFSNNAARVQEMSVRSSDIFVATFPKSGTTWMQELVWLLVNDCDFEKAKKPLNVRSPFLEMSYLLPQSQFDQYERDAIIYQVGVPGISRFLDVLEYCNLRRPLQRLIRRAVNYFMGNVVRNIEDLDAMTERRVIKTHLPFDLLPPNLLDTSKVVYVARNPKDVIVSYYHYHRIMHFHLYTGDLETFADYFISDKVYASPFFPHLKDAWSKRHHPNLLFVFYEDLKKDLQGQIKKVAEFLGQKPSEEQLKRLTEHLQFEQFSKNEAVNFEICKNLGLMDANGSFMRKGKTGDWKNHFSSGLIKRIDKWMESNLADTDLKFITELEEQD